MSILPIDKSTLVYGSSDAGTTVFNSDKNFEAVMNEWFTFLIEFVFISNLNEYRIGKKLNLRAHLCGTDQELKTLISAVDIGC